MTPRTATIYAALLLCLSACASLGLEPAQGLTERIGYAYAATDALVQSTTTALDARTITSEEALYVRQTAVRTRDLLQSAEAVHAAGDTGTAEARLALAQAVLRELQSYVTRQKGTKP